jgi:hypothetical protein
MGERWRDGEKEMEKEYTTRRCVAKVMLLLIAKAVTLLAPLRMGYGIGTNKPVKTIC